MTDTAAPVEEVKLTAAEKRKLTMQKKKEEQGKEVTVPKKTTKKEKTESVKEKKVTKGKGGAKEKETDTSDKEKDSDENQKVEQRAVTQSTAVDVNKMLKEQGNLTTLTNKEVREVCETFVQHMINTVRNNKQFTLTNVATFKKMLRNERYNTNPQIYSDKVTNKDDLQKKIYKPAHYVMVMNVRKKLKDAFEEIPVEPHEMEAMKDKIGKTKSKKNAQDDAGEEEEDEDEEEEEVHV
jgi:nucleoid DNA-binding protein